MGSKRGMETAMGSASVWNQDWRDRVWSALDQPWELLIIGGGITGAGLLREAARVGLRALLVEQRDFAWGASSRSSKLVHGGLRYLKDGHLHLTRVSVRERERLLRAGPGLIEPLGFLAPTYKGDHPGRWAYAGALAVYDLLGGHWGHRHTGAEELSLLAPHLSRAKLTGGFSYGDAQTDDARLVLRLLREAATAGATPLNYVAAESLLWESSRVAGVVLRDVTEERTAEVRARVVVNATGAWADRLRGQIGAPAHLRPLRGSHLIFPAWRLPVAQAINFAHPRDRRPVFALPWQGVTLVGTTDMDHAQSLDDEPGIQPEETAYLMEAIAARFPSLDLTPEDALSAFSGVRPVIDTGKSDPSQESRDVAMWEEAGLLTVTGGKLTTFRQSALLTLRGIAHRLPGIAVPRSGVPALDAMDPSFLGATRLDAEQRRRLVGRYGADAAALVAGAQPGDLEPIPGAPMVLWAEARWAARAEGVVHLDDLLLRRLRLGLLLRQGGAAALPTLGPLCQAELGWDDARWEAEVGRYLALWREHYSVQRREAVSVQPEVK